MSNTSIITPGENIASAEDWKAGEGTMVQGEHVISTMMGIVNFDQDEQTISIASDCKGVPEVRVGDTVIAEIAKIRESMLEARILHVEGDDGREPMPQHLYGQIHVTKMVDRYLHDASDGVRRRDIIRATVTDNNPVIRLDMRNGDDCGVLQAICPQCGNQLITAEHEDWNVACSYCNYLSFRALSKSFGLGYNPSSGDAPDYNKSGKRWGKEAEQYFAIGPAARSNLIATDFRNDGREVEHFRFEGTGGGGGAGRGGGRKERPTGRKIFVGGLSREVSDDDLLEAFKKYGKVVDHVVMKDRETGNNRGFGFVTFAKDEDGDKAISGLNKQDFMGRRLTVNDAGDKKGDKKPQQKVEGTRLYVGGLPWKINNEELTKVFSEHGKVNDCHIVMDGDRSKGFGFVTVSDESADKVVEALDGQEIQGRRLKVAKAKARSDSKGGRKDSPNGGKSQRTSREMQARKEEGLKD